MTKNEDAYQCTLSCYAATEGYLAPCSYRKGRKMPTLSEKNINRVYK